MIILSKEQLDEFVDDIHPIKVFYRGPYEYVRTNVTRTIRDLVWTTYRTHPLGSGRNDIRHQIYLNNQ